MKKRIYWISLVLALLFGFQIVNAGESLKLSGKITNIEIEENKYSVLVSVHLKMSLKTISNEAVLLWKQTYPDGILDGSFLCVNSKIFGITAMEKEEKVLHYYNCALPSLQRTRAWQDIQNELDNKTPPSNMVQIINSGESFDFYGDWKFIFLKKKALGSNDPLWGYGSMYDVLWDEMKDVKNLSLQVTYRVWSSELEPRSAKRDKRPFGKKLQKRWRKYGYLWLDDIQSEPIALDLKTAVVR